MDKQVLNQKKIIKDIRQGIIETVEETADDLTKEVDIAFGQKMFRLNEKIDQLEEAVAKIEAQYDE